MILIFVLILLILRILYSLAEVCYERDFPRNTWRGLALSMILFGFCLSVFA